MTVDDGLANRKPHPNSAGLGRVEGLEKPTADAFTQTNRHFATRSGFAVARRSNVNAIDLRIQFGELLHVSDVPQCPTIETAASRYN